MLKLARDKLLELKNSGKMPDGDDKEGVKCMEIMMAPKEKRFKEMTNLANLIIDRFFNEFTQ